MAREPADLSWRMPLPAAGSGSSRPAPTPSKLAAAPSVDGALRVADYVDHTLLKAEARRSDIDTLCDEASTHRFAAVCVNGCWVARCSDRLAGTGVKVATVVGFPLGAMPTAAKAFETKTVVDAGADEVDMVVAVGHVLDEDWDFVENDIRAVVNAAAGRVVKVILETGVLQPLQIVKASVVAKEAGAHFVKTSTGFHPAGGATAEAVAIMRMTVGDALRVKAAGGIRDCATALRMIGAGATRIGTSSGVKFVECMGESGRSLSDLIGDPETHEASCRTGACAY
jgi:deoxyribose-phosphate aldolase